jgi:endonuclease/exonuclease/phosphatase family metal-dependent hydrolase
LVILSQTKYDFYTDLPMIQTPRKKLSIFDKIVIGFNILSAFLLVLSYFSPVSEPAGFWPIAFLGLVYPVFLVLNLLFIIYWLFRRAMLALISFVSILFGIVIIIKSFGFHSGSLNNSRDTSQSLRVMEYNVHGFLDLDRAKNQAVQTAMLGIIDHEKPDIVAIEEFYVDVNNRNEILSALHKSLNSPYFLFKPYDYTQWDSTGVAIFSRFPIVARGVISLGNDESPQAIYADIKRDGKIFRVYCLHLRSIAFSEEDHDYIKLLAHKGQVSLPGLQSIFSKLKQAYIVRAKQARLIKQHANSCPYPYIISGDFNDTPNSYAVNTISEGLNNSFVAGGSGAGITYYGDFPHFQIDYIFASPQYKVQDYTIIKQKLSDHYPVVCDLLWQK